MGLEIARVAISTVALSKFPIVDGKLGSTHVLPPAPALPRSGRQCSLPRRMFLLRDTRALRANAGPLVFVWSIWAAFCWYLVDFVRAFGVDCPYFDEWEMIPTLTGNQPITLKWLWSQHNEHRIFLPRLMYLAVEKVARYDFRAGMFFDVFALGAAAAALIVLVRRIRGRTEYTDAFFPVLVLNLGQAQTFTNSFQICLVAGTLLFVAALMLSVHAARLGFRSSVALGVCAILLPLVGGHGVALVPALAVCVVITGWGLRGEPRGRWKMLFVWALAGIAVALTAFYFVNYTRPAKHPVSPGIGATLDASVQFLTTGFGAAARFGWPQTRFLFFALVGASVVALIVVFKNRPEERARAARVLLFLVAMASLALGIGWARNALGASALFASRYVALAAPFWCAIYLAWEFLDRAPVRHFVQMTLLFCASTLVVANHQDAKREAVYFRDVRQSVVLDLRAGMQLEPLVTRHKGQLYYGDRAALVERMKMLRDKKIGAFGLLHP